MNERELHEVFGRFQVEDKRDRSQSVIERKIAELYRAHQEGDATRARQIEENLRSR